MTGTFPIIGTSQEMNRALHRLHNFYIEGPQAQGQVESMVQCIIFKTIQIITSKSVYQRVTRSLSLKNRNSQFAKVYIRAWHMSWMVFS